MNDQMFNFVTFKGNGILEADKGNIRDILGNFRSQ